MNRLKTPIAVLAGFLAVALLTSGYAAGPKTVTWPDSSHAGTYEGRLTMLQKGFGKSVVRFAPGIKGIKGPKVGMAAAKAKDVLHGCINLLRQSPSDRFGNRGVTDIALLADGTYGGYGTVVHTGKPQRWYAIVKAKTTTNPKAKPGEGWTLVKGGMIAP